MCETKTHLVLWITWSVLVVAAIPVWIYTDRCLVSFPGRCHYDSGNGDPCCGADGSKMGEPVDGRTCVFFDQRDCPPEQNECRVWIWNDDTTPASHLAHWECWSDLSQRASRWNPCSIAWGIAVALGAPVLGAWTLLLRAHLLRGHHAPDARRRRSDDWDDDAESGVGEAECVRLCIWGTWFLVLVAALVAMGTAADQINRGFPVTIEKPVVEVAGHPWDRFCRVRYEYTSADGAGFSGKAHVVGGSPAPARSFPSKAWLTGSSATAITTYDPWWVLGVALGTLVCVGAGGLVVLYVKPCCSW